jgi:hypothetical protein
MVSNGVLHQVNVLVKERAMSIDPNRLTVEDASKLLSVSPEQIAQDVEAGLPTNPDGTINLVHYAAWLIKEMGRGND